MKQLFRFGILVENAPAITSAVPPAARNIHRRRKIISSPLVIAARGLQMREFSRPMRRATVCTESVHRRPSGGGTSDCVCSAPMYLRRADSVPSRWLVASARLKSA